MSRKDLEAKKRHHCVWAKYLTRWGRGRKNVYYTTKTGKIARPRYHCPGRTPFHGPAHRVSKDLHTGEVHFSLYRLWANPIAGGNRPATHTFLRQ